MLPHVCRKLVKLCVALCQSSQCNAWCSSLYTVPVEAAPPIVSMCSIHSYRAAKKRHAECNFSWWKTIFRFSELKMRHLVVNAMRVLRKSSTSYPSIARCSPVSGPGPAGCLQLISLCALRLAYSLLFTGARQYLCSRP
jgi:hypothetical protein